MDFLWGFTPADWIEAKFTTFYSQSPVTPLCVMFKPNLGFNHHKKEFLQEFVCSEATTKSRELNHPALNLAQFCGTKIKFGFGGQLRRTGLNIQVKQL